MKMMTCFRWSGILMCLGLAIALPAFAGEADQRTLASISGTLTSGVGLFIRMLWAACILVGIGLLMAAFTQYQIHRVNPKLVPLPVPLTYLFLALLTLALPFSHTILGLSEDDTYRKNQRYEIIKKNYQQYFVNNSEDER